MYTWGYGKEGQLGHGEFTGELEPRQVVALKGEHISQVSVSMAGLSQIAYLVEQQTLKQWVVSLRLSTSQIYLDAWFLDLMICQSWYLDCTGCMELPVSDSAHPHADDQRLYIVKYTTFGVVDCGIQRGPDTLLTVVARSATIRNIRYQLRY